MEHQVVITLDIDWAPDFMVNFVRDILVENNVKATWFVTHNSNHVKELAKIDLFELGIHPNFSHDSTQGKNVGDVLSNLKKIIPNSKSIRTHGLLQSTPILQQFQNYDIENDVSLFIPNSNIAPHYLKFAKLYRFPYFWEDDINMMEDKNWNFTDSVFQENGLKIFDFHPLHIYFNFASIEQYQNFKIKNGYTFSDEASVSDFINRDGHGAQTFFRDLVSALSNRRSYVIEDLKKKFLQT